MSGARRVRVVLAGGERRPRPDAAAREVEEQTPVGEVLVRGLVRTQLALALRLSLLVAVLFGVQPVLFAVAPDFPAEILPEDAGLILADAHAGDLVRDGIATPLASATRKAMLLRFARAAAGRLTLLHDPQARGTWDL